MTAETNFENARLKLFESVGRTMAPVVLEDREGRPIYTLQRGTGETRVFFHGGLAHAGEWCPLIEAMNTDDRIVLVDRPGCGLTYGLDYRGVDYRRHAAEFVEDVIDALELTTAHIVANSMGGYFALAFALAHPERVDSLTLIGAPAGLVRYIPFPLRLMSLPGLGNKMLSGTDPANLRKHVYPLLVADPRRVSDATLELGILNNQIPGVIAAARTMLANVLSLRGWRRTIREDVMALDVCTRFVWGSNDAFESTESGQALAKAMPNAEFVVVDDAGHLPWHDQPEACASAIEEFWAASARLAA